MSPFAHLTVIEFEVTRCTRITGDFGDTKIIHLLSCYSLYVFYIAQIHINKAKLFLYL